jgi:hypothetical protein
VNPPEWTTDTKHLVVEEDADAGRRPSQGNVNARPPVDGLCQRNSSGDHVAIPGATVFVRHQGPFASFDRLNPRR